MRMEMEGEEDVAASLRGIASSKLHGLTPLRAFPPLWWVPTRVPRGRRIPPGTSPAPLRWDSRLGYRQSQRVLPY